MKERIKMFEKKEEKEKGKKEIIQKRLSANFQERILRFNSISEKTEEKQEKIIPKKIDMKRHSLMMNSSIKGLNALEKPKSPPKKLSIEDHLAKLQQSTKKCIIIKRKIPKKIYDETYLEKMKEEHLKNEYKKRNSVNLEKNLNDENNFENLTIRNRSSTVAERLSDIKQIEIEKKRKEEEEKRLIEEDRKKMEEQRKRIEELRKKREEERKKKEEEERKRREEERKRREEERKREEEERKKREEEERKKWEEIQKMKEEERKKWEEKERKREEEERKKWEEKERKREEERKRKEEEEEKRKKEEEKKKKEEDEMLKMKVLTKNNKKEEDYSKEELSKLIEIERLIYRMECYECIRFQEYGKPYGYEGKHITYTFEEKKSISIGEKIISIEVTDTGKLICLSNGILSKITIYAKKTYQEEECIMLESKVNSMIVNNNNIYCALDEDTDNILIISLSDYNNKIYLSGHNYGVTDLTFTKNYLMSTDIKGNIFAWFNNEIVKKANDSCDYINSIIEVDNDQIAVLCFKKEKINFYDLFHYSTFLCINSIYNIKGSGLKNNMLKLNENILAVAGTFIYIIDLKCLQVINQIYCFYANDSISSFHFNNKGFFFVSQALTDQSHDDLEKGILGYYQYYFDNKEYPEYNRVYKLASKIKCHEHFIYTIKKIDSETIVTGSYDGKMKFWNLKKI